MHPLHNIVPMQRRGIIEWLFTSLCFTFCILKNEVVWNESGLTIFSPLIPISCETRRVRLWLL